MDASHAPRTGLSKSRFLTGSQCPLLLWRSVHEPDAAELVPDAGAELIFRQGHLVGEEARRRFPGGVLVDLPHELVDARIARTRELMDNGTPAIFEASFRHAGVFVAVDVLERQDDGSWALIEVKSSTKPKDENLLDVALQRWVLEGCGVDVSSVHLMHLSRACVFPDLGGLFESVDLTAEALSLAAHVAKAAPALQRMLAGAAPRVQTGEQCTWPRACAFHDRCHGDLPEHHVSTLYRIGRKADALAKLGHTTIFDLPEAEAAGVIKLSAIGSRQVAAVTADRVVVEPGLNAVLGGLVGPVAYFDLETVAFAIPRFAGTRPWDAVPAQASIHIEADGKLQHRAFLTPCDEDPRAALGRFIIKHLSGARTVLSWNVSFEKRCLDDIGRAFPRLKRELDAVSARLVDLLPIVRDHVYHPAFFGSFSLKAVAPALAPELSYAGLDVAGGMDASAALFTLFTDLLSENERARLRTDLLAYCGQDTAALVAVLKALRVLAATIGRPKRGARQRAPTRSRPRARATLRPERLG